MLYWVKWSFNSTKISEKNFHAFFGQNFFSTFILSSTGSNEKNSPSKNSKFSILFNTLCYMFYWNLMSLKWVKRPTQFWILSCSLLLIFLIENFSIKFSFCIIKDSVWLKNCTLKLSRLLSYFQSWHLEHTSLCKSKISNH